MPISGKKTIITLVFEKNAIFCENGRKWQKIMITYTPDQDPPVERALG
jgi:hypothetical protein